MTSDEVLAVEHLSVAFGGLRAVSDVSFTVSRGETVGVVGPNGSGKTSLLNVISRLYQAQEGAVRFLGRDLLGCPPHRLRSLGLARSFQNVALYPRLTVLDNLKAGYDFRCGTGLFRNILGTRAARRHEREAEEEAWGVLDWLRLSNRADTYVAELAYGDRKMIDTGRALMASPSLVLLDEPASGIPEANRAFLADMIASIPSRWGASTIVIDHDVEFLFGISDKMLAMNAGRLVAVGTPAQVRIDPAVVAAYLGDG